MEHPNRPTKRDHKHYMGWSHLAKPPPNKKHGQSQTPTGQCCTTHLGRPPEHRTPLDPAETCCRLVEYVSTTPKKRLNRSLNPYPRLSTFKDRCVTYPFSPPPPPPCSTWPATDVMALQLGSVRAWRANQVISKSSSQETVEAVSAETGMDPDKLQSASCQQLA